MVWDNTGIDSLSPDEAKEMGYIVCPNKLCRSFDMVPTGEIIKKLRANSTWLRDTYKQYECTWCGCFEEIKIKPLTTKNIPAIY